MLSVNQNRRRKSTGSKSSREEIKKERKKQALQIMRATPPLTMTAALASSSRPSPHQPATWTTASWLIAMHVRIALVPCSHQRFYERQDQSYYYYGLIRSRFRLVPNSVTLDDLERHAVQILNWHVLLRRKLWWWGYPKSKCEDRVLLYSLLRLVAVPAYDRTDWQTDGPNCHGYRALQLAILAKLQRSNKVVFFGKSKYLKFCS